MSESRLDFVALALAGKASADEIDDFIDEWHEHPIGLALHDYLGMTPDEYRLWLNSPDVLPQILTERKQSRSLEPATPSKI